MKVYFNNEFAYQLITNDVIDTSAYFLNTHIGFGGTKAIQFSKFSLDRYVVTVDAIQKSLISHNIPNSFEWLNLSMYNDTLWQIACDLNTLRIK